MKKLLAIALFLCIAAGAAFAQPPSSTSTITSPYPGFWHIPNYPPTNNYGGGSVGDIYQFNLDYWIQDFIHGQPGNPYNFAGPAGVVPSSLTAYAGTGNALIQFEDLNTNGQRDDGERLFMWQENTHNIVPPTSDHDQYYYINTYRCVWQDLPEYVGCTEYFLLYIYQPLCVDCVCLDYKCLGLFTIPSYHLLVPEQVGVGWTGPASDYGCDWQISGQPNWFITLSGEVIATPNDPQVFIQWYWKGQQGLTGSLHVGGPFGVWDFEAFGTNWTRTVQLDNGASVAGHGKYAVGLLAQSITIGLGALPGVHTYDATVSAFYSM